MKKKNLLLLSVLIILIAIKLSDLGIGLIFKRNITEQNVFTRKIILREHQPLIDKFVKPSKEMVNSVKNLKNKKYRLRTNNNGFIVGPEWKNNKDVITDIIFVGGCTTECMYVEEINRFPYLLSKLIKKKNGSNLNILNGGVAGNHSVHSLINLIAKGINQKPKFMIFMHNINDLGTISKTLSYWEGPKSRKIIITKKIDKENKYYDFLKRIKNFFVPNTWEILPKNLKKKILLNNEDEWKNYRNEKDYHKVKKIFKKNFTSSILSFIKVARAWDIEPILMTQFNRVNIDDVEVKNLYKESNQPISYVNFVYLYNLGNQIIRDIAYQENILLIDLDKKIPSNEAYIYDAAHLTSMGSKLVAQEISEVLLLKRSNYFKK